MAPREQTKQGKDLLLGQNNMYNLYHNYVTNDLTYKLKDSHIFTPHFFIMTPIFFRFFIVKFIPL